MVNKAIYTGLLIASFGSPCLAQELLLAPPAPPNDLAATARAAKDSLRPTSPEQLQAARAKLEQDLAALDRLIGKGANGQAWRKFLLWDELQAQMATDAKPDAMLLDNIRHRYLSGRPGLRLPAFAAVARSMAAFEEALLASSPDHQMAAAARLEALAAALEAKGDSPSVPETEDVADAVRWLALRGQTPEVVKAARTQYGKPNFYLHMSEPFIGVGMERKVNRTEPITDVILGTRIRGTGTTSGYVSTQLVPNPHRATIDNVFEGVTYSRTVGRNGTATIHSAGQTTFQVRKRIYLDPSGLNAMPATASANTNTRTLGVDSGRGGWLLGGIADNIARNRVAQSKRQSEAISADHAEDRLTRRVDDEANPELATTNKDYLDKVRYPLLETGQFPPDLKLTSTNYYIYGVGTEANRLQLGAPDKSVPWKLVSDLGFKVHQSAVNNLADGVLAGTTRSQTEFENWVKDMLGRLPKRFERAPDEEDWIINFSAEQPVRVRFDDHQVTVTLHVDSLEGRTKSDRPWTITAVYKIEPIPGGLRAVRQGEIDVWPTEYKRDAESIPGSVTARIPNIKRQFEKGLFEPEIVHEGLELTGDWEKLGRMPLIEYFCRGGWVHLAWNRP